VAGERIVVRGAHRLDAQRCRHHHRQRASLGESPARYSTPPRTSNSAAWPQPVSTSLNSLRSSASCCWLAMSAGTERRRGGRLGALSVVVDHRHIGERDRRAPAAIEHVDVRCYLVESLLDHGRHAAPSCYQLHVVGCSLRHSVNVFCVFLFSGCCHIMTLLGETVTAA
jgi:hypothetical protein